MFFCHFFLLIYCAALGDSRRFSTGIRFPIDHDRFVWRLNADSARRWFAWAQPEVDYIVENSEDRRRKLRAQLYAAKAYSSQANIGDEYRDLKGVVTNFVSLPDKSTCKFDVIFDNVIFEYD